MTEILTALIAVSLCLLLARWKWTRATERVLAAHRAAKEDSEALAAFADGLTALTARGVKSEELARGVVRLALSGTRSTSGAYYAVRNDGSLSRMGVEGRPPFQGKSPGPRETLASGFADLLGTEIVPQGTGLVGVALAKRQTSTLPTTPDSRGVAELAIPVFAEELPLGVLTVAGPTSGRDFDERTVLLAEKMVRTADRWLQQAVS